MKVHEILKEWLQANGYDGLYAGDGEYGCCCTLDNLITCWYDSFSDCKAGYTRTCKNKQKCNYKKPCGPDCDRQIGPVKQVETIDDRGKDNC